MAYDTMEPIKLIVIQLGKQPSLAPLSNLISWNHKRNNSVINKVSLLKLNTNRVSMNKKSVQLGQSGLIWITAYNNAWEREIFPKPFPGMGGTTWNSLLRIIPVNYYHPYDAQIILTQRDPNSLKLSSKSDVINSMAKRLILA